MLSTLLCKAKVKYNGHYLLAGDWIEGYLLPKIHGTYLFYTEKDELGNIGRQLEVEVFEESICRCSGFSDINGKLLFDKDWVSFTDVKARAGGIKNKISPTESGFVGTIEYNPKDGWKLDKKYRNPEGGAIELHNYTKLLPKGKEKTSSWLPYIYCNSNICRTAPVFLGSSLDPFPETFELCK